MRGAPTRTEALSKLQSFYCLENLAGMAHSADVGIAGADQIAILVAEFLIPE